ncbi:hypothetical protein Tco_0875259 [Tanacetum coccineum]|uniref:Xylulose kinase-1 n=1 Tax=Tanacetum coccineum TaxID=301880 RepID=A0ABQ5BPQ0_9ASTR
MTSASLKKHKTGNDEVNVEALSHGVPQEEEGATPSQNVSREEQQHTAKKEIAEAEHKVGIKYASDADSASDDDTPVNLYAVVDWELLPTGLGKDANLARQMSHDFEMTEEQRKRQQEVLASAANYSDAAWDIILARFQANLDLSFTIFGVEFTNDDFAARMTVSGLVLHMFVDKKYPFSVNLIERMLDHQLEICHRTVGNELTTAVQLIAFLKKQIFDSKRPKVHDWYCCYNKEWLVQEGTTLGKDYIKPVNGCDDLPKIIRLASPRVNGYFVKASSNPFLFFDSPLLGVNTPWDVMRIVCFTVSIYWFCVPTYLAAAHSLNPQAYKYVVPTGRVKVPAGRYVVPTGKDNVIVSAGRSKVIPAGLKIYLGLDLQVVSEPEESLCKRNFTILTHKNFTMTSQNPSQTYPMPSPSVPTFSFPSTTEPVFSVSTSELKEEYERWPMKMEYWIINSDHNLWNIVLNGNIRKKIGRDPKGNIMILPPVFVEEQIDVQRERKARTILLQSLLEDHMADFYHLDDARDIWLAVKARFGDDDDAAGDASGDASGDVSDAAAEFALMGLSS